MTTTLRTAQEHERACFLARLAEVHDIDADTALWADWCERNCPPATQLTASQWRHLRSLVSAMEQAFERCDDGRACELRGLIRREVTRA